MSLCCLELEFAQKWVCHIDIMANGGNERGKAFFDHSKNRSYNE